RLRGEGLAGPHPRRRRLGAGAAAAERLPGGGPGCGGRGLRRHPCEAGRLTPLAAGGPGPVDASGRPDYKRRRIGGEAFAATRFIATSSHGLSRVEGVRSRCRAVGSAGASRASTKMANTSSARKATRKIARRTEINQGRRSMLRSYVRKVEEAIAA